MPELSRAQIFVYAAIAVVALLLGSRWIKGQDGAAVPGDVAFAAGREGQDGGGGGDLEISGGALVVHVTGAVADPGVYRMPDGSRVTDALERAGGATRDAAQDSINLAAPLADGQQVVVPAKSQAPGGVTSGSAPGSAAEGPISLGTATLEQLETIEGIGPVTAASILQFRDENGGLGSIDELDEVSGIGPATMEALRSRLQP